MLLPDLPQGRSYIGDQAIEGLLLPGWQEGRDEDLIDADVPEPAKLILHLRGTPCQQQIAHIGLRPAISPVDTGDQSLALFGLLAEEQWHVGRTRDRRRV